jgi:hypothetical protein
MNTRFALIITAGLLAASPAAAQFDLSWNAVACGGGISSSGTFSLDMTIGQSDAWSMSAGAFVLDGDFWPGTGGGPICYANCDGSTVAPVLTVNDFICFQSAFAAGSPYANCDGSTVAPVLTVNDFICFQSRFAAGCS